MASARQMPRPAPADQAPVSLIAITATGCEVEAGQMPYAEGDFVRLLIDDRILINGTVVWRQANRAGVHFFGELHPVIVEDLSSQPAGTVSARITP